MDVMTLRRGHRDALLRTIDWPPQRNYVGDDGRNAMAAKYVLYFDSVRHDNEKTVRRAVILVIVLAHVMLFWSWGRQHLVAISSLTNSAIFVELHNTLPLRATTVEKR